MARITPADIATDQQVLMIIDLWVRGDPVSDVARRFCLRRVKALCADRRADFEASYEARSTARDTALLVLYVTKFSSLSYREAGRAIARAVDQYKRCNFKRDLKLKGPLPGDPARRLYFDICRTGTRIPNGQSIAKIVARESKKRLKPAA